MSEAKLQRVLEALQEQRKRVLDEQALALAELQRSAGGQPHLPAPSEVEPNAELERLSQAIADVEAML